MSAAALLLIAALTLPLAGALVAVAVPRLGAWVAGAISMALLPVLAALWVALVRDGVVTVALGGWDAPLGILLAADGMAVAFMLMTALVIAGAIAHAARDPSLGQARAAFWPLLLLVWGALNAVFVSRDLFNLYVGIELLSLAAVAMVAIAGKAEAIAAALRYLVYALTGSLLYLAGVVLVYSAHGTLDIALIGASARLPTDALALGLMSAGLMVKTALFPFHVWLPPAHSAAPAPASALLSGLVPKASFLILLRLWFEAMPDAAGPGLVWLLGTLGALAVLHGSVMALRQDRLKLIVAYSTVAQIGYLFLLFPLAAGAAAAQPWAEGAWSGAMFQVLSHGLAKASMFLCAGLWIIAAGSDRLEALRGLARAMPMTAMAFGIAALSLTGLPPTGGFTAKYLMMIAAFGSGQVVWALVMAAGGLLAVAYLYRPMAQLFVRDIPEHNPVPRSLQMVPLALALAAMALGMASGAAYDLVQIGRTFGPGDQG